MIDWLRAEDAKRIASGEVSRIMYKIKDAAYKGEFFIILDYRLRQELAEVMRNYGYKINYVQDAVYEETPYGVTDKVESYKETTVISWL